MNDHTGNAIYRQAKERIPLAFPAGDSGALDAALVAVGATPDAVSSVQMEEALRTLLRPLVSQIIRHGTAALEPRAGLIATDARDCVVTLTPVAALLVGLTDGAAVIGRARADLPALAPYIPALADFARPDEVRIVEHRIPADERRVQCVSHIRRGADGTPEGVSTTVQDTTVQRGVYAEVDRLYRASEARVRELTALAEIGRRIALAESLDQTLAVIAEKAAQMLGLRAAAIFLPNAEGHLALAGQWGLPEGYVVTVNNLMVEAAHFEGDESKPPTYLAFHNRTPVYRAITSITGEDPEIARATRVVAESSGWAALLGVPLIAQGVTIGALTCYFADPDEPPADMQRLVMAIAGQAAISVRNSKLYAETQRALAEATRLHESISRINATLDRPTVLQTIVEQAAALTGAVAAALGELAESGDVFVGRVMHGFGPMRTNTPPIFRDGPIIDAVRARTPIIIRNHAEMATSPYTRQWHLRPWMRERFEQKGFQAFIAMPFAYQDGEDAALMLLFDHPITPSESEIQLLATFTEHAAVAMHNARLYDQAQQVAVVEERNRLARDLHDSVTQSLFSMSLLAQVIPTLLETNPDEATQSLHELRRLSKEALAEMRALLFQLRPVALEEDGLVEALTKHVASLQRRDGPTLRFTCNDCEERLPLTVEEAIFRVATEAINNALKHAHARQIDVHIEERRDEGHSVVLTVRDDGSGFDPAHQRPQAGHLGLSGMKERVARGGGILWIESAPGAGTTVTVRMAVPEEPEEQGEDEG